jgi:protein-L-isoaspartate(D-aspartate) O-methyltransferase
MPDYARPASQYGRIASPCERRHGPANRRSDATGAARAVRADAKRGIAYADAAIEIVRGRFLLEPRTFSKLLQLAAVGPGDSVFDIGCATGYSTAVIAHLARTVIGLEQDADLVRDGLVRPCLPRAARTPRSSRGRSATDTPRSALRCRLHQWRSREGARSAYLGQLAEGGRLVAVIRSGEIGRATLYLREHGRVGYRRSVRRGRAAFGGLPGDGWIRLLECPD